MRVRVLVRRVHTVHSCFSPPSLLPLSLSLSLSTSLPLSLSHPSLIPLSLSPAPLPPFPPFCVCVSITVCFDLHTSCNLQITHLIALFSPFILFSPPPFLLTHIQSYNHTLDWSCVLCDRNSITFFPNPMLGYIIGHV